MKIIDDPDRDCDLGEQAVGIGRKLVQTSGGGIHCIIQQRPTV